MADRLGARWLRWGQIWFVGLCLARVSLAASADVGRAQLATSCGLTAPAAHSGLYSYQASSLVGEDVRKLSRVDFRSILKNRTSTFAPASEERIDRIPAGTDLNVVLNVKCLLRTDPDDIGSAWLSEFRQELVRKFPARTEAGLRSFTRRLDREREFEEFSNELDEEPCVRMVGKSARYELMADATAPDLHDPLLNRQDHLKSIRYSEAFNDLYIPFLIRKKVTIAIIDSGVDFQHEDLRANRWINPDEIADNAIDDDHNGYVDDVNGFNFANELGDAGPKGSFHEANHGTHVAGLAAARLDNGFGGIGVDGVAKIMSLNIFGDGSGTNSALLENAIRYAADHGADVINLSLGGREFSRTMKDALSYAISNGSFIVSAAGNFAVEICENPEELTFVSPAAYAKGLDGMIATASIDAVDGKFSTFSNYSRTLVEISAPGAYRSEGRIGLWSTYPGNNYAELAGTSMSAPVLAGAAALAVQWLKTYGYEVTPQIIKRALTASSRRDSGIADYVEEGRTLDVKSLVDYLKQKYPAR